MTERKLTKEQKRILALPEVDDIGAASRGLPIVRLTTGHYRVTKTGKLTPVAAPHADH